MPREATTDDDVVKDTDASRYELTADGGLAGVALYEEDGEGITFVHTVIAQAFQGRGLGGRLARAALDDARRRGQTVVPECPYIAEFLRSHGDWDDIVDPEHLPDRTG